MEPCSNNGTCDTVPPVITITGVSDVATYELGLVPTASYTVMNANCQVLPQATPALLEGTVLALALSPTL